MSRHLRLMFVKWKSCPLIPTATPQLTVGEYDCPGCNRCPLNDKHLCHQTGEHLACVPESEKP